MSCNWKRTALTVALIGALLGATGCKKVPDLKGKTRDEAKKVLDDKKLTLGTVSEDAAAKGPAGTVAGQTPEAGAKIPDNKTVNITLVPSATTTTQTGAFVAVPNVIGQTPQNANSALAAQGLVVGTVSAEVSDQPDGLVFYQNPQQNAQVAPGTTVDLKVASKTTVTVPALVGQTQADAFKALLAQGLAIGPVTPRLDQSASPAAGTVIETNPNAGIEVAKNTPVKLYVKQDATTVPMLKGLTSDAALQTAQSAHLYVVSRCTLGIPLDTVLSQNPPAGTQVARDSDVAVSVAQKACRYQIWERLAVDGKRTALNEFESRRLNLGH